VENMGKFKDNRDYLQSSLDLRIDSYLKALKVKSSEKVINGSIKDAQEILNEISALEENRQKISAGSFKKLIHNNTK